MISITVLGALDVREAARGSLTTLLVQPRRAAVLVYLAVAGDTEYVSRDALLALLWQDNDEERARAALRQSLTFLRRTIGEQAIQSRGDDALKLDPTAVSCDWWAFRDAIAAGRDDEALDLYRGDFLDGLVVGDAPAFEQWTADRRQSLAKAAASAAARSSEWHRDRGAAGRALERALVAKRLEPFNESHHRRILSLMDAAGDRSGALREHEAFVARLRTELEVAPSPETEAVVSALKSRSVAMPPSVSAPIPRHATTPSSRPNFTRFAGVLSVLGVLVAAIALLVWRRGPTPSVAANVPPLVASRIAVLPLTEQSADSAKSPVGVMAADWITEGLSRLEGIEVVPASALLATHAALPTPRGGGDATSRWREVATDVGAGVVVRGAIYREGRVVHLQTQVVDTRTGRLLQPVERVSVPDDSVMAGIDRLRTRVVASFAPLADTVTHLRRAVAPPTYDAYRDYVAGLGAFVRGATREALVLFERSAAADASYPMPRIAAAITRLNLNDADGAERLLVSLRKERDRLGPLEQSTLDMVQGLLYGDLASAYDAVVRQARIAPGTIGEYMVAELARKMNRPAEAVMVLRALGADRGELRGWRPWWREMTYALHTLGKYQEELVAARDGMARYPRDLTMISHELRALAALANADSLHAALTRLDASNATPSERAALRVTAATEAMAHDTMFGRAVVRRVTAWFDSLPASARDEPDVRRQEARALLLAGRADEARARLRPLVASADVTTMSFALMGLAGGTAAAVGDTIEARRWVERLTTKASALSAPARGLTWGESTYWRATIAARLADSTTALALLREARRDGLGMEPSVHAEPAFAGLRSWPPFAALLAH